MSFKYGEVGTGKSTRVLRMFVKRSSSSQPSKGSPVSYLSAPRTKYGSAEETAGALSGYEMSPRGPGPEASRRPSTNNHKKPSGATPSQRLRAMVIRCHSPSAISVVPHTVRLSSAGPVTPKATRPPVRETP
jgi:hypothetical protein